MAILSLRRWERVEYESAPDVDTRPVGTGLFMKLKRLKRHETKPLAKALVACFQKFEEAKETNLSKSAQAAILAEVYTAIPEDQLKSWFGTCVKDVEGLEIDGEPVTTGPALLEEADDQLVFWLLMKLNALSKLTQPEGKGLSSPSMPLRLVAGTDGSSSPAPSIENVDGQVPSTVTETQATAGSSTARG